MSGTELGRAAFNSTPVLKVVIRCFPFLFKLDGKSGWGRDKKEFILWSATSKVRNIFRQSISFFLICDVIVEEAQDFQFSNKMFLPIFSCRFKFTGWCNKRWHDNVFKKSTDEASKRAAPVSWFETRSFVTHWNWSDWLKKVKHCYTTQFFNGEGPGLRPDAAQ